jgi:hypothetical protein
VYLYRVGSHGLFTGRARIPGQGGALWHWLCHRTDMASGTPFIGPHPARGTPRKPPNSGVQAALWHTGPALVSENLPAVVPFQSSWRAAVDGPTRPQIIETAVVHARCQYGEVFSGVVCVGDAPWDMAAARELAYVFVGVGRNGRSHTPSAARPSAQHFLRPR